MVRSVVGRGDLYSALRILTMSVRRWRRGLRHVDRLAWIHRWADV